jgi:hypothetical protein
VERSGRGRGWGRKEKEKWEGKGKGAKTYSCITDVCLGWRGELVSGDTSGLVGHDLSPIFFFAIMRCETCKM